MSLLKDAIRLHISGYKSEPGDPPHLQATLSEVRSHRSEAFESGAEWMAKAIENKFCGDEPAVAVIDFIASLTSDTTRNITSEGDKNG